MPFLIKAVISAFLIIAVSELAKRSTPLASILASVPLISVLAMIWLYCGTRDVPKIIDLSWGIFWAVFPSMLFFVALPLLLKGGVKFSVAMILSCLITFFGYSVYLAILNKLGMRI